MVDDPILIQGIEERLLQVFRNLINNAISFSPDNGVILLIICLDDLSIKIYVEDDGPGLKPGSEKIIFNRFYKERPDGEKFGIHSGLGLSISKQIVRAHGGDVWAKNIQNTTGKILGARFIIELSKAE